MHQEKKFGVYFVNQHVRPACWIDFFSKGAVAQAKPRVQFPQLYQVEFSWLSPQPSTALLQDAIPRNQHSQGGLVPHAWNWSQMNISDTNRVCTPLQRACTEFASSHKLSQWRDPRCESSSLVFLCKTVIGLAHMSNSSENKSVEQTSKLEPNDGA